MTSLFTGLVRGAGAGAAGTTALDLATRTDMALRARPASDTPTRTVEAVADRLGVSVPGRRGERARRLEGLGALGGAVTGVGVGALAGVLRASGVRLPGVLGAPLLGAGAMAAADLPMARLGVTDPRRWTTSDWLADAVPHLAYGITTHATLAATFADDERVRAERPTGTRRPATTGTLARAAALGAATGARSSAGLAALACRARRDDPGACAILARPVLRAVPVAMAVGEAAIDKSPVVPPRDSREGLPPRVVLAATSADLMSRRDQREGGPAALVAVAGAIAAALGGKRLRETARRTFRSDLPGALVEDGLAALLAWAGSRRPARIPH